MGVSVDGQQQQAGNLSQHQHSSTTAVRFTTIKAMSQAWPILDLISM
jgi:hypothetical protein